MADILIICIREEDRADFPVELIKGLMARGLTVSYAGAYYCRKRGCYVYDDVTNLLFFTSAYFREAQMKSRDFSTWAGFLDNIDFEHVDARLVVYAIMCTRDIDKIIERSKEYLVNLSTKSIVKLIRSSFCGDIAIFEPRYPEITRVLNLDNELLNTLKERSIHDLGSGIEWPNGAFEIFDRFTKECRKLGSGSLDQESRNQIEPEIKSLQDELEKICLEAPQVGKQLVNDFLRGQDSSESYIQSVLENPERPLYFDLSRMIPKKDIFCIYYEESDILRGHERKIILHFYPEKPTKEAEEPGRREREEHPSEERNGQHTLPRLPEISRDSMEVSSLKEFYSHEKIGDVIDKHIMRALHPPPVGISFPVNEFMLEVDPEESEIGFLSREITLKAPSTLGDNLGIDMKLDEKLLIYGLKEDIEEVEQNRYRKFHKLETDYRKEGRKKICILGRLDHLYELLLAGNWKIVIYQKIYTILALIFAIILSWIIWHVHSSNFSFSMLFWIFALLIIVRFIFWIVKPFFLNYILDPMYKILEWSSYILLISVYSIISSRLDIESPRMLIGSISFVVLFFCVVLVFRNYISSAAIYDLNNWFKIIDYEDILKTQNLDGGGEDETVKVLRCGRFQTVLSREGDVEVFFNSHLFPRINYICKRKRASEREIAYSSNILVYPQEDKDIEEPKTEKEESIEKLLYRKPRTWGFWRTLKSLILGKGKIEEMKHNDESYDRNMPDIRFIYLGQRDHVMEYSRGAISVFPQSTLFRNMLILAAISVLFFNILLTNLTNVQNMSLKILVDNMGDISKVGMIILIILISMVINSRVMLWKISLIAVFCILIYYQPHNLKILAIIISLFLLILLRFPFFQALSSFVIWLYEAIWGNIITIIKNGDSGLCYKIKNHLLDLIRRESIHSETKEENFSTKKDTNSSKTTEFSKLRGKITKKNFLVTHLTMDDEEIIYFNWRFLSDIILSGKWHIIRQSCGI